MRESSRKQGWKKAQADGLAAAESANDTLRPGAGMRFLPDNGLTLVAHYQGELEEHSRNHSLMFKGLYVF